MLSYVILYTYFRTRLERSKGGLLNSSAVTLQNITEGVGTI